MPPPARGSRRPPSLNGTTRGRRWLVALLVSAATEGAVASGNTTRIPESRPNGQPPIFGARLLKEYEAPLRTNDRYIVNNRGERIKWACVGWYGAYSTTHAVGGLEVRPLEAIVDRIVELGFNCVRMMYSTQGYVHNPPIEDEFVAANPDLQGMRFLEVFDRTVHAMTEKGLMVIINNHNSKSGWCCHYSQDEGLWYVPEYSEEQWIESLVFFAARYRTNPLVVGYDLRNEVHDYQDTHLTWGGGDPKTDWAAAAVRAGNAVLTVHPDVLIVVMAMCFGMDLRLMRDLPLQMMYPNRIVYQTHNYLEYQVFDNIAKIIAPWHVIREWCTLANVILLCFLVMLWYCWVRIGKPQPPSGLITLSVFAWFIPYFLAAAFVSWQVYQFGMLFCAVAMESDVMPWIQGSLILVVCCILGVLGAARQMCLDPAAKVKVDEEEDAASDTMESEVPCERQPLPGKSGGTRGPGERPMRSASKADSSPASVSASSETASPASTALAGGGQKCASRRRRFASWSWTLRALAYDVEWLARRVLRWLGFRVALLPKRHAWQQGQPGQPAEWDAGMTVALQFVVVACILILTILFVYIWAHILPTYWWMERHLDGLWGFALEAGKPYTAPIWMGEFGGNARGQWWLNFVRYLSARDVDFAYWALNGKKWAEGAIDGSSGNFITYDEPSWQNETFGLLNADYETVRHPWKLLDVQTLLASPSTWRPEVMPCTRAFDPGCLT